jgi:hypothetical protein
VSDTLAGFTAYTTTKGLPAFKQRFQTADGKVHETRIEAPGGVGLELIGGRAYIVAREATVYFQPEGLAGISLPKADSAQAAGLAANYGIGPEFLERGRSRETSIETNDPSLAKVGLGLGPSPAFGAPGGIDFGPIVAVAVVLAALGVLALALSTRRKQES